MKDVATALRRIVRTLTEAGCRFAVIGGIAVSARSEPRFTRDVDLAVAIRADDEAEALVHALLTVGYRVKAVIEQKTTKRLATVRLEPRDTDRNPVVVDLLFASSGVEPEIVSEATLLEVFPGVRVLVAQVGHLLAMKLLSRNDRSRPRDLSDLVALMAIAKARDILVANRAVKLISARGFARGRNLEAALKRLVRAQRPDLAAPSRRRKH